jgi:hypothetical protein
MIPCKFINLLFSVFPVRAFQGFLIKNHFEKCPHCQNSLVKAEELRLIFVKEENAFEMARIWPGIREKLYEGSEGKNRKSFFPRWRWALSSAVLTVLVLTGFLYLNGPDSTKMAFQQDLDQPFQINYIKVEEKPAGTYVYEPEDSEMIFVWAEEILP